MKAGDYAIVLVDHPFGAAANKGDLVRITRCHNQDYANFREAQFKVVNSPKYNSRSEFHSPWYAEIDQLMKVDLTPVERVFYEVQEE